MCNDVCMTKRQNTCIDELSNDELRFISRDARYSLAMIRDEFVRVERVINAHAMTHDDLSYWFERQNILGEVICDT